MNELTYNGKKLSEFGVYYDSHPAYGSPERDVEMVEIAGRNGSLIIDNDRFRNIDLSFPCYCPSNFLAQYRNAMAFLQSSKGYNRLEYSEEPDHFRMASFNMGSQPEPNQRAGHFPVVFNCKPQRFLKSGETPVSSQSQSHSYEGNPVSISNPSGLSNVSSLSVDLEPIQDLHGYEYPWVGGAGKNILNYANLTASATGVGIQCDANGYISDSTPTSDVRTWNYASSNWQMTLPSGTYTMSIFVTTAGTNSSMGCRGYKSDGTSLFDAASSGAFTSIQTVTRTFTLSSETSIGILFKQYDCVYKIQLEKGNESSSWSPYSNICPITGHTEVNVTITDGETYTSSLGTTVYGGSLDIVSGVLTVTHNEIDLGDLTWTAGTDSQGQYFSAGISPKGSVSLTENICSCYKVVQSNAVNDGNIAMGQTGNIIYVRDTRYANASDCKTGVTGQTFVYKMNTPTTTQLTPTQVSLLTGTNIITCDSGDMTVTVTEPSLLVNPTLFESKPLLRIYGTGTVNINDQYITISAHSFPYIDIDCELMDAYYGSSNANQYVTFSTNDYITLRSGNNYIAYGNQIEVTPRWYEI